MSLKNMHVLHPEQINIPDFKKITVLKKLLQSNEQLY
jgi:hypothetical protein